MKFVLFCVFLSIICAFARDDSRVVNINQGPVKGYKTPGYDVFAFYGIPYATAPTGTDKFKGPLPPPSWTDTFEAVDDGIRCLQNGQDDSLDGVVFKEDCLIANVFVPETDATNLPVILIVHGGAFQRAYGNIYPPNQLVNYKKNVIVVNFNYRLGPLGFLCLGTPDVPGNAGMRDQVAALRWVHENIANFGGNPDDVTLAGCSAGGASIDLLLLSKTADGLYNKAIAQSGPQIGANAVQLDPIENARIHARNLNYDGPDNLAALENFYKNVSNEELLSLNLTETKDVSNLFTTCVERDLGFERFLDDTPVNILRKGNYNQVPMLYGWASMEGIYRVSLFEDWKNEMNADFTQFVPIDLEFENAKQKQEVAQQIKELYFGDAPVSGDNILSYIDFHTDVMFVVPMQRAVTLQVEAGNNAMYLSVYSYVTNFTEVIPYANTYGATHCIQYRAVFDRDESVMTPEDVAWRQTMRDIWLNFVLTGEPTPADNIPASIPKWEPVGADRTPCMELGNTVQVLPGPFNEEKQAFWDDLYDRLKREPVAPYDF